MNTILLAAIAALALAETAKAADIRPEIGFGINHYEPQSDGTWYQLGKPHQLRLNAQTFTFGVTGPLVERDESGIDWHVDYIDFGGASSHCVCTPLDSNYDNRAHVMRADAVPVPDSIFVGHGHARGLLFKATAWKQWKGFRVGLSAGLAPYRQTWHETVYNWTYSAEVPTRTVRVDATQHWELAGMVGVSLSRGRYTVAFDHYDMPFRRPFVEAPPLWVGGNVLSVSYQF